MDIAIIGTGYVGLVTGTCFADTGNQVICVDNNLKKIKRLQNSEIPIYEPGLEAIFSRNIERKRMSFSSDLKMAVLNSEIIFLCLPTPQDEDGSADLTYVMDVSNNIGKIIAEDNRKSYKIVVNKSTVPVGTTKKIHNTLSKRGAENFDVISNPEFLREGFAIEDFMKPDRIVIGSDSSSAMEKLKLLYEPFVRQGNPIFEMDPVSSELTKYAANSYLAMRITYMNELANLCEKVGANIDFIRKGIGADNRIGNKFLYAGIGFGGSCFPKDVSALIKTSMDYESKLELLSTANESNKKQKRIIVKKLLSYFKGNLENKQLAIWGLSFKPNTDDMREAPSLEVIKELLDHNAKISAYDPVAMENAKHYLGNSISYATDEYSALKDKDALLILTEWNEFRNPDFKKVKENLKVPVILDGRNLFQPQKMEELGFDYISIGRRAIINKEKLS